MSAISIEAVMDLGASYAECLRTMNAAASRGITFDMDKRLRAVVGLAPEYLELLLGMAQDFNKQECLERCARNKEEGVKYGRPEKALPENFWEEARNWAEGRTNFRDAAKNCGMPSSTFRLQAEKAGIIPSIGSRKDGAWPLPEGWDVLVNKIFAEEISFEGAAIRAGLSVKTFKMRLHLHRKAVLALAPKVFVDAAKAWADREMTLKAAAMHVGYNPKTFESLLKITGFERCSLRQYKRISQQITEEDDARQGVSI